LVFLNTKVDPTIYQRFGAEILNNLGKMIVFGTICTEAAGARGKKKGAKAPVFAQPRGIRGIRHPKKKFEL